MKENEIIEFIYENFSNGRKKLFPKINEFISNDICTQEILNEFNNLNKTPFCVTSNSSGKSRNSKTKSAEVGDICDIWTFCLNPVLLENSKEEHLIDRMEDAINNGNEIHICTIWTNWFLPVYYIETTYEFKDKKKGIAQSGKLNITDKDEIENYNKILEILDNLNYFMLDFPFLDTRLKNISTDCSDKKNATIFECLFSDLRYPTTEHTRRKIYKKSKSKSKLPEMTFIEHLDENRVLKYIEAEIYQRPSSWLHLTFDNENNLTEVLCGKGKIEKSKGRIRIKFENKKTNG